MRHAFGLRRRGPAVASAARAAEERAALDDAAPLLPSGSSSRGRAATSRDADEDSSEDEGEALLSRGRRQVAPESRRPKLGGNGLGRERSSSGGGLAGSFGNGSDYSRLAAEDSDVVSLTSSEEAEIDACSEENDGSGSDVADLSRSVVREKDMRREPPKDYDTLADEYEKRKRKARKPPKGYVWVTEEEYHRRLKIMQRNSSFVGLSDCGCCCFIWIVLMGIVLTLLYLSHYARDPRFFDPLFYGKAKGSLRVTCS
eukprot:TRINITY_DN14392_c0_g1_i1.p1 TRINITY_DN14392_c0_g1~~TRINITY_DN14392_c0_g1_i1.p1  ORF type:complete len:257 (+),score=57.00 TRINITY_DN14392_c0_g1_i1:66-836(+)